MTVRMSLQSISNLQTPKISLSLAHSVLLRRTSLKNAIAFVLHRERGWGMGVRKYPMSKSPNNRCGDIKSSDFSAHSSTNQGSTSNQFSHNHPKRTSAAIYKYLGFPMTKN